MKQHHVVGKSRDQVELMTDEQHGLTGTRQSMEQLEDGHFVTDVEKRGRLVEHDRASTLSERAGQPHALPFAAGYRVDAARRAARAPRPHRSIPPTARRSRSSGRMPGTEVRESPELNVFENAHGKRELLALRDDGHGARELGTVNRSQRTCRRRRCRRASARTRPISARTSVLFPLPFGPTTAVSAPRRASSDTPASASVVARGYRTTTSSKRIIEGAAA